MVLDKCMEGQGGLNISRRRDKEVVQVVVRGSSLAKSPKPNRGSEHKGDEATGDPQQPAGASGCSWSAVGIVSLGKESREH